MSLKFSFSIVSWNKSPTILGNSPHHQQPFRGAGTLWRKRAIFFVQINLPDNFTVVWAGGIHACIVPQFCF
jgi:hypothetical protein